MTAFSASIVYQILECLKLAQLYCFCDVDHWRLIIQFKDCKIESKWLFLKAFSGWSLVKAHLHIWQKHKTLERPLNLFWMIRVIVENAKKDNKKFPLFEASSLTVARNCIMKLSSKLQTDAFGIIYFMWNFFYLNIRHSPIQLYRVVFSSVRSSSGYHGLIEIRATHFFRFFKFFRF